MIRPISAADTIAVRWPVLRPGFPRETAVFNGDDDSGTLHFGAFDDGKLVGVASIYVVPCSDPIPAADGTARPAPSPAYQLRGMATLPEVRGAGHGKALLDACVAAAREHGAGLLWCNARTSAVPFYEKNGWQTVGAEFDIPTVGPHFRMCVPLACVDRFTGQKMKTGTGWFLAGWVFAVSGCVLGEIAVRYFAKTMLDSPTFSRLLQIAQCLLGLSLVLMVVGMVMAIRFKRAKRKNVPHPDPSN